MKVAIVILFLVVSSFSWAQNNLQKKADKAFNEMAYLKAISLFTKLIDKEEKIAQNSEKIGVCYLKTGNSIEAEKYFKDAVYYNNTKVDLIYNYAYSLLMNGKYPLYHSWMKTFTGLSPKDSRAIQYLQNTNYIDFILADTGNYKVNLIQEHKEYSNFSPVIYGKNLVFVSNQKEQLQTERKYSWDETPFLNLKSATIDSLGNLTEVKSFDNKLNSKYHEGPACFNKKGDKIYFTRSNYFEGSTYADEKGINNLKIFTADLVDGKWVNEKALPFNSDEYSCGHPTLSEDEKVLYFVSDKPGGFGGSDLYSYTINHKGSANSPVNLGSKINTEGNELFPYVNNQNELYFSSNGHMGLGGLDLFKTNLRKIQIQNLGADINSNKDDFGITFNKSNTKGYFSSNRKNGTDDIYKFETSNFIVIKGRVIDIRTKLALSKTTLTLLNNNGVALREIDLNDEGIFNIELDKTKSYQLVANFKDYKELKKTLSLLNNDQKNLLFEMIEDDFFLVEGMIKGAQNKVALSKTKLKLLHNSGKKLKEINLNDDGSFNFKLPKDKNYVLVANSEGYKELRKKLSLLNNDHQKLVLELLEDENSLILAGLLQNAKSKLAISKAKLSLLNNKGEFLKTIDLNDDGSFYLNYDSTKAYELLISAKGYKDFRKRLNHLIDKNELLLINLLEDDNLMISGIVKDAQNKIALSKSKLTLLNNNGNALKKIETEDGEFSFDVSDLDLKENDELSVKVEADGYISNQISYKAIKDSIDNLKMIAQNDLELTKIDIGEDIGKALNLNLIYFDLGSFEIRHDAKIELNKIIQILKENPEMVIELGSHTDSRGSDELNKQLSQKRAEASKNYILSQGINSKRVTAIGYGESKLVNHCNDSTECTEEEHQQNRRTEFVIIEV